MANLLDYDGRAVQCDVMYAKTTKRDRPFAAVEGTWPLEEWPLDVQRVDENGIDLSLIEHTLSLTPAERLAQLEQFVKTIVSIWRSQGLDVDRCINSTRS